MECEGFLCGKCGSLCGIFHRVGSLYMAGLDSRGKLCYDIFLMGRGGFRNVMGRLGFEALSWSRGSQWPRSLFKLCLAGLDSKSFLVPGFAGMRHRAKIGRAFTPGSDAGRSDCERFTGCALRSSIMALCFKKRI